MVDSAQSGASSPLAEILTFRNPKKAMRYLGIIFLALLVIAGISSALELGGGVTKLLSLLLTAVVLLFTINGVIAVSESRIAIMGLLLVMVWIFLAVAAPILPLHSPNEQGTMQNTIGNIVNKRDLMKAYEAQGLEYELTEKDRALGLERSVFFNLVDADADKRHWLSVDHKGRDMLSRLIWGAQRVLIWATAATVVAYIVGMFFGVAAGYLGGWWDELISFVANVMLSFPVMVLFILIVAALGASGFTLIIAVTFASAPAIMRIVRGLTLDLKSRDYIAAAQTRGESSLWVMIMELLPNARGPLIVDSCLRLGYTTIAIATLGFLGLGLPPPDPDWGQQLSEARNKAQALPHMVLYPAFALSSLILGFNLLADGLRDISLRD